AEDRVYRVHVLGEELGQGERAADRESDEGDQRRDRRGEREVAGPGGEARGELHQEEGERRARARRGGDRGRLGDEREDRRGHRHSAASRKDASSDASGSSARATRW